MSNESFGGTLKIVTGAIDLFLFNLSMYFSFYIGYKGVIPQRNWQLYTQSRVYIAIFFVVINILFGVYVFYNKTALDFFSMTVIIEAIMTVIVMATSFFGRWFAFPRSVLFINFLISTLLLSLWRYLALKIYFRIGGRKRVLLVGKRDECFRTYENIRHSRANRYEISGMVVDNYVTHIQENMDKLDVIYLVSNLEPITKTEICKLAVNHDKDIFLNTEFENMLLLNPSVINIEDESIIKVSKFKITSENRLIKRIMDVLISLVLLLVTAPISLITAILIKATSPGPIFYKQVRVTKHGDLFNILKFRSMSATAEKSSGPVLASVNDPRITPIGNLIRATRIDELPQLLNVLKGDMSLVGPRPERPFFVEDFKKENQYYDLRHNVRAGITGYAQVYGKYSTDFNSKLDFDLIYIKEFSLLLDIKIMLQTIKILFDKVSSEGVKEDEEENSLSKDIIIYK